MRTVGNKGMPGILPCTMLQRCAREHLTSAAASVRFRTLSGVDASFASRTRSDSFRLLAADSTG